MMKIEELVQSANIAAQLDEETLAKCATQVYDGYIIDEDSRADWLKQASNAMLLVKQVEEPKNYPFTGAANVMFPLLLRAAIDFAARTYPEIVKGDKVVGIKVNGMDPTGQNLEKAIRVSKHMSYQLLHEASEWERETDQLLQSLAVVGTVFRKTYYDMVRDKVVSEFWTHDKIIVNANVRSLKDARRITQIISCYKNDIIENIRSGIYSDIDVDTLVCDENKSYNDADPCYTLVEQHCYLDLDEDGYKEPYSVTMVKESKKILRIVARYSLDDIVWNDDLVVNITPLQQYVDYHFIPSPDGSFYSLGLGHLLYPLNKAANSVLNQIIDAGNLYNNQCGFIGKGLRVKGGEVRLQMGEWKIVDSAYGSDIKSNIVPLPAREPSGTLFQVLGMLIEQAKDLSSVQDSMLGKGPTTNVTATTTSTHLDQSLKVFSSIQRRLQQSLQREFQQLFKLNSWFVSDEAYQNVLNIPGASVAEDYDAASLDVIPVSDPAMSSEIQRMAKAQALMSIQGLDPFWVRVKLLQALEMPEAEIQKLNPPPDPKAPPPPELQQIMADTEYTAAKTKSEQADIQLKLMELEMKKAAINAKIEETSARIAKIHSDSVLNYADAELKSEQAGNQANQKSMEMEARRQETMASTAVEMMKIKAKEKEQSEKRTNGV